MLKKCIGCGEMFEPWPGWENNQKYCTIDCMKKYNPIPEHGEEKVCVICGKIFHSNMSWKHTCSPECSEEYHKRKYYARYEKQKGMHNTPKKGKETLCVICGKPFVKIGNKKTCSYECRKALRAIREEKQNEKRRERRYIKQKKRETKPKHEVKCVVCGKVFATSLATKMTCSKECAETHRKEHEKERMKIRYLAMKRRKNEHIQHMQSNTCIYKQR